MLTQAQYQFFQTFGFVVLRQVFTKSELLTIDREFEAGLNAAHADKPFDGTERHGATHEGSARRAAWLEKLRYWGFMEEPA